MPYLRGMKMIQDPKIKIYKKICSKLPLIPSYNGFHGSVKITGIRKYQRWNLESHPLYEDLHTYQFDVEVHGKIHAVYSGNHLSWWGSEIQKDGQFSSRKLKLRIFSIRSEHCANCTSGWLMFAWQYLCFFLFII